MFYLPSTGLEHMFFALGQDIANPSQYYQENEDDNNNGEYIKLDK